MWAVVLSIPWPTTTTNTKWPRAHTVSAKHRRRQSTSSSSLNNHFEGDDDDVDNNSPISKIPKRLKSDSEEGDAEEETQVGVGVGGSDILWALQKASAAQKHKVKQKKRENLPVGNQKKREIPPVGGDAEKRNDCRPLRIRTDWNKRLDDLEKRLGDLTNSSSSS